MIKNLVRTSLCPANLSIEHELELFVGLMLFNRNVYPSHLARHPWDLFVVEFSTETTDNIWAAYHTAAAARYFPDRPILVVSEDTWKFFDTPTPNMVQYWETDWLRKLLFYLEK
jgi:hypothetical protein